MCFVFQGYSALCALLLLASAEENKESKATDSKSVASETDEKRQDKRGLEHHFGGDGGFGGGDGGFGGGEHYGGKSIIKLTI